MSNPTIDTAKNFVKRNAVPLIGGSVALATLCTLSYVIGYTGGIVKTMYDTSGSSFSSTPYVGNFDSSKKSNIDVSLYAARDSDGQPQFYIRYSTGFTAHASARIEPKEVLTIFTDKDLDQLKQRTVEKFVQSDSRKVLPSEVDALIRKARETRTASR